jgi:phosphonate transport system substrate-binding protein
MLSDAQKLTSKVQKLIILISIFISLNAIASEKIVLGITGVALKNDISAIVRLKDYLKQKTKLDIKLKFARTYSTMRNLIMENSVNVAYICGATYVDLKSSKKIELLALPTVDKKPYYYSLVIAKKNSNYKKIDDFKGKVYAMSDPESNSGSLVPRYELQKRGYKGNHFFKRVVYTYDHGESIEAVLDGFVQGASVDSIVYGAFLKNFPKSSTHLKVIQKFGPYPTTPFVISKKISKKTKNKIQQALINMVDDKNGKEILDAMAIGSFIKPNNLSYAKIEKVKFFLSSEK